MQRLTLKLVQHVNRTNHGHRWFREGDVSLVGDFAFGDGVELKLFPLCGTYLRERENGHVNYDNEGFQK